MKNLLFVGCMLLASLGIAYVSISEITGDYEFIVDHTDQGYVMRSCHGDEIYKENLILPQRKDQTNTSSRKKMSNKMWAIQGGYWDQGCLIVPVEDKNKETVMTYILQMTNLKKEEVKITYPK